MSHLKAEDVQKAAEFVNFVTRNMVTTSWTTDQCLQWVRLLGFMQREFLPTTQKYILEVTKVIDE